MGSYETKKVNTGSFNSFYCEGGVGNSETIIFLHGSGPGANSESNWSRVLNKLSETYHVIAPDMIGFGKTDLPEDTKITFWEWTTARVRQVLEIMDYNNIEKAHLVGNSMGGVVSLNALMYDESRFDKVVLMGSGGGAPNSGPTPEIVRMTQFFRDPTIQAFRNLITWFMYDESVVGDQLEEIVKMRYENIMQPETRELYPTLFATLPHELTIPPSALRRIKQQVLLIHGYEDRFVPHSSSLSVLEHLPNAELVLLKECGHWVQIEKFDRFIQLVNQFFSQASEVQLTK
ncbi:MULTISPECIES: alpha/beta fold hydrolase [Solibacillus]|uniref:alpha/beta fold hydrolase n=1 Tax=Solibacillus TaxID=648800 RepID=UPI00203FD7B9|nr:alpha/beta hydrolase [Solibacillus isronensis]MCM3721141.1 alpha/beta fold hydrolase [Solibacillus isronensis]